MGTQGSYSEKWVSLEEEPDLLGSEDLWVVVEVAQGSEGMLMLLELCEGIAQGLTLHLPRNCFKVPHHSTL